jgi:hypothetical protein
LSSAVRAPNKSRLDDVVQEIVDTLERDPDGRFSTELSVRATISILCELDREVAYRSALKERVPIAGKRQENVEDFESLLKHIEGLQKAFSKASGPALIHLFSGDDVIGPDQIPSVEVQQKVEIRLRRVIGVLAYMRARCDFLLDERPGVHGGADFRQRRVAHEAWRLLKIHGKEPAGGTMDSLFGQIASLLYEAMTGDADKDLQWACKAALRLADEGELRVDGPTIGRGLVPMS